MIMEEVNWLLGLRNSKFLKQHFQQLIFQLQHLVLILYHQSLGPSTPLQMLEFRHSQIRTKLPRSKCLLLRRNHSSTRTLISQFSFKVGNSNLPCLRKMVQIQFKQQQMMQLETLSLKIQNSIKLTLIITPSLKRMLGQLIKESLILTRLSK